MTGQPFSEVLGLTAHAVAPMAVCVMQSPSVGPGIMKY